MDSQNVTVSLPADLLREVRRIAIDQGVSPSRLIALLLEQELGDRRRYQAARARQISLLQVGLPLGTHGSIRWEHSEFHER